MSLLPFCQCLDDISKSNYGGIKLTPRFIKVYSERNLIQNRMSRMRVRVTSLFSRRCSFLEHDRISSKLSREKHEHFKSSTLLVVMEHDTLSNDTSDKKGRLN